MNRIMGRHSRTQYGDASRYYMSGSNAVAADYLYQEELEQQQNRRSVAKPKRKSEVAQWLATLTVVFAMGMALVGQYAYIGNLGYEVTQAKAELKTVQMQNEKIKNQISAAGGLQHVEMVAVNYMGMHRPDGQEVIYLSATE